ncbi:hypothetical protein ACFYRL_34285 [Streptomyces goshikiensis]|uniref:hypothetical protein n=1 Tax=Streptomyces goshikiensis TaxID=1942 RepID=UPI0036BD0F5A
MTLHTLHWADEIRDPQKEIDNLPGKTTGGEATASGKSAAAKEPAAKKRIPVGPMLARAAGTHAAQGVLLSAAHVSSGAAPARRGRAG